MKPDLTDLEQLYETLSVSSMRTEGMKHDNPHLSAQAVSLSVSSMRTEGMKPDGARDPRTGANFQCPQCGPRG